MFLMKVKKNILLYFYSTTQSATLEIASMQWNINNDEDFVLTYLYENGHTVVDFSRYQNGREFSQQGVDGVTQHM